MKVGATMVRVRPVGFRRACLVIKSLELPAILVVLAPPLLFPTPRRLVVLFLVPLFWLCAWIGEGRFVPKTPMNSALLVILGMVGVDLWVTPDVTYSLGKISGVVLGILLYWGSARWLTGAKRLRSAVAAYIAAGAGLAGVALLGTNWPDKVPLLSQVIAHIPKLVRGIPGALDGFHPNAVAGCLVLFIPLQVELLASGSGRRVGFRHRGYRGVWTPVGQALLLAVTSVTLVLTQSRGGALGLWVGLVVLVWWHGKAKLALTAALLSVLAAGYALFAEIGGFRVAELLTGTNRGTGVDSISGRVELWARAIEAISDFPLAGMGMNVFRRMVPIVYPTFLTPADLDVAHAHNQLLQTGADLGLPGLVAYVATWLLVVVLLVHANRLSTYPVTRASLRGLGAGFVAHFVFGLTDAIPLGAKVGVLFWLALALLNGLHEVARRESPQDRLSNSHSFARK